MLLYESGLSNSNCTPLRHVLCWTWPVNHLPHLHHLRCHLLHYCQNLHHLKLYLFFVSSSYSYSNISWCLVCCCSKRQCWALCTYVVQLTPNALALTSLLPNPATICTPQQFNSGKLWNVSYFYQAGDNQASSNHVLCISTSCFCVPKGHSYPGRQCSETVWGRPTSRPHLTPPPREVSGWELLVIIVTLRSSSSVIPKIK